MASQATRELSVTPWGASCRAAGYWAGEVSRPPWICSVEVFYRERWVRRWGRGVVRVQWLVRGSSRVGMGLGGLGSFGVDVVAWQIRFLVVDPT